MREKTMLIDLHAAAPHLDPAVADRAARAYTCEAQHSSRLLVADMSQTSTDRRLWVFDLRDPSRPVLIERTRVAHGAGSDPRKTGIPESFGNRKESGMTSLGLYRVAEPYIGVHGKSYILDGLTPGFDDQARARSVVLHPAPYVRESGSVGRSLGCPAISPEVFTRLDKQGALQGALLWVDGPDPALADAASLRCAAALLEPPVCRRQDSNTWGSAPVSISWQWAGAATAALAQEATPWKS